MVGNGNVALDIARILLSGVDVLRKTDISEKAIEALKGSRIRHVNVVGRRGPMQVCMCVCEEVGCELILICTGCIHDQRSPGTDEFGFCRVPAYRPYSATNCRLDLGTTSSRTAQISVFISPGQRIKLIV